MGAERWKKQKCQPTDPSTRGAVQGGRLQVEKTHSLCHPDEAPESAMVTGHNDKRLHMSQMLSITASGYSTASPNPEIFLCTISPTIFSVHFPRSPPTPPTFPLPFQRSVTAVFLLHYL